MSLDLYPEKLTMKNDYEAMEAKLSSAHKSGEYIYNDLLEELKKEQDAHESTKRELAAVRKVAKQALDEINLEWTEYRRQNSLVDDLEEFLHLIYGDRDTTIEQFRYDDDTDPLLII